MSRHCCSNGMNGLNGQNGLNGDQGPPGAQGQVGLQGEPGLAGLTGPQGVQGVQGPAGGLSQCLYAYSVVDQSVPSTGSPTYENITFTGGGITGIDGSSFLISEPGTYEVLYTVVTAEGPTKFGATITPSPVGGGIVGGSVYSNFRNFEQINGNFIFQLTGPTQLRIANLNNSSVTLRGNDSVTASINIKKLS